MEILFANGITTIYIFLKYKKKNSTFQTRKAYFKKNGILKKTITNFYAFPIEITKEYDETGKLIKEIDNDLPYKFSIIDLQKKIKIEYQVDIVEDYRDEESTLIKVGRWTGYDKGLFGKAIEKLDYKKPPIRIRIRFLGLYDTVLSYTSSKVNLTIPAVGFVAHLTAENEHRMKFPLTNIASASNGKELTLPGVHSDIGGGYKNGDGETVVLSENHAYLETEQQNMLEQGWFKPSELVLTFNHLNGVRSSVINEFSLVVLHLMAEFGAQKYKIPWKYEKILDLEFKIPSKIDDVKARVYDYAFNNAPRLKYYTNKEIEAMRKVGWKNDNEIKAFDLKVADHNMLMELRNKYLHCSASMDGVGMEPRKQENRIDPNWNREILPD
jgi:Uncharacterized alpha/beta hydrolase domain (DUF2235)